MARLRSPDTDEPATEDPRLAGSVLLSDRFPEPERSTNQPALRWAALADTRRNRAAPRTIAPTGDIVGPWDVHPSVIVALEPQGPVAEQYRAARTWILSRQPDSRCNCLAVTSSLSREGRTVTVANLAVAFSEVRHARVLAMDCDLRSGALGGLFRAKSSRGLGEVLTGRIGLEDAVAATAAPNLWLLPSGDCGGARPTELLNSPAVARVFDEIRERFHYVIVDAPPVELFSDVGAIGALCGAMLMVVRMRRTPAHLVRQSLQRLQSSNLHVLGCIAGGCRSPGDRDVLVEPKPAEPL